MGRLLLALVIGLGITAFLYSIQQVSAETFVSVMLRPGYLIGHAIFTAPHYSLATQTTFVANALLYAVAALALLWILDTTPRAR